MMKTYAYVDEGKIVELIATDGDITEMFHPSMVWVDVTEISPAPEPGWSATQAADSWSFAAQVPVVSVEELAASVMAEVVARLAAADDKTLGMADAYIADLLDDADKVTFKQYAAYKLELAKVKDQAGYPSTIVWPDAPQ